MSKLVLIDGNAIMHRAYHALPPLTTRDGEPINAVYGLVSMLMRIVTDLAPTHLAVCFDRPEPTFRKLEFSAYQSHRPETDKELSSQFEKARDVLTSMNIEVFEKPGFEADDLIGTLATRATKTQLKIDEVIIVTGDRDILQLVDDAKKIAVFMPVKGLGEGRIYFERDVVERMGVKPSQIVDYKGLVGDPSDNYPGVSGIGPKTAIKLLDKYGGFTNIYKNIDEIEAKTKNKLESGKEKGDISFKLAKIITDMKVDFDIKKLENWDLAGEEVIAVFNKIGFKTLLSRTVKTFGFETEKPQTRKKLSKTEVEKVAKILANKLSGKIYVSDPKKSSPSSKALRPGGPTRWAIRGTASLVLQNIEMGVDDIDLVCDQKTAEFINSEFKKELVKKVEYSETDKYKSYFGQLIVDGILVEVMGELQIKSNKGWGDVYDGSDDEVNEIEVGDGYGFKGEKIKVRATKPEIELKVSAEMGRWNEFHKMKKQIGSKLQTSLF
ncbi:MAG: polymerase I protein [Candidatus Woesebacteria bacterium GW2011_GWA1_37_8]|uniref:Polymerase I protein n=2 Tax=Candidatus Woeseibacteriota TaxID=1752722 RepID=A0A0G0L6A3_9BACT|nr:MAG: polymerase I protein [Microgenomates group bacterium GW2011_GWC1_37_12b]KKQ43930.1 MAG: polymerase I protein [Candidatus Woesebacteria bacterium GW2011_GWA1_37_8]KKQ87558.1 MAG: polymerase I protein [Candidatus Woesebacteria bacterium GW2011_GWB1_38_8b]